MSLLKKVHFVGIKGVGMTAMAGIAHSLGWQISGSDEEQDFITKDNLATIGVVPKIGFKPENLPENCDLVIFSASHAGNKNPEVTVALERGIKSISLAQAINYFLGDKKIIAVAGTHGKTTTSAMLTLILKKAGLAPSWFIGTGQISGLPGNGGWDRGELAVIEADEYIDRPGGKSKFLYLNPFAVIISSTDFDHPDVFPTHKIYLNSFHKLIKRVYRKGILVLAGENAYLRKIAKSFSGKIRWVLPIQVWHNLKLSVFGQHNFLNATFAATMAHELGVDQKTILSALLEFKGVQRRLEIKGKFEDWLVIDDYAHHPTEIKAALQAVRHKYRNFFIAVVFEPHTYSRTKALIKDFAKSFNEADQVFIAPTFSSAREVNVGLEVDLVEEVKKYQKNILKIRDGNDLIGQLSQFSSHKNKILITMGAGSIYNILQPVKV